jgi:hypothetical protein
VNKENRTCGNEQSQDLCGGTEENSVHPHVIYSLFCIHEILDRNANH